MKTKIIFSFTSNSRFPNIQEVRPYHRADKCITRVKNKLFIYGPQCDFVRHFRVFGGGDRGGGVEGWVSPSCLPAILLPISIYI